MKDHIPAAVASVRPLPKSRFEPYKLDMDADLRATFNELTNHIAKTYGLPRWKSQAAAIEACLMTAMETQGKS